jgi:hypothetical protein
MHSASECIYVCPSVRMEQLGCHWTDFHEILYLSIFRKSVEKIQLSLNSGKNDGYFTWRPHTFLIIYFSILLRIKKVSDKICRENHNTRFILSKFPPPPENRAVYIFIYIYISGRIPTISSCRVVFFGGGGYKHLVGETNGTIRTAFS